MHHTFVLISRKWNLSATSMVWYCHTPSWDGPDIVHCDSTASIPLKVVTAGRDSPTIAPSVKISRGKHCEITVTQGVRVSLSATSLSRSLFQVTNPLTTDERHKVFLVRSFHTVIHTVHGVILPLTHVCHYLLKNNFIAL